MEFFSPCRFISEAEFIRVNGISEGRVFDELGRIFLELERVSVLGVYPVSHIRGLSSDGSKTYLEDNRTRKDGYQNDRGFFSKHDLEIHINELGDFNGIHVHQPI
jgi:hypothetical protein